MEQHPIPQNVSSYQFKLVGDMTLKQFFQLAGGFLVGLLFYSTGLPGLIKWPIIIISVILGALMAFVPFEERPLEQWIFAFFQAIYSPTVFRWKKSTLPQKFFADEANINQSPTPQNQDAVLKNYLEKNKNTSSPLTKLEGAEMGFLSKLTDLFAGVKTPVLQTVIQTPAPQTPSPSPTIPKNLEIPPTVPVKITPLQPSRIIVEEKLQQTHSPQIQTQPIKPVIAGEEIISTKEAIFSIEAAPPNPPTNPNVVVGQAVDMARKIIESVIIEIKDEYGRPVRALRSNKLGHFLAVTPLDNGKYSIVSEKDGYQFTPVYFEARGDIIPPILVEGRKLQTEPNQTQTN